MEDRFNYDYIECRSCLNYDTISALCQISYCYVKDNRVEYLRESARQFHARLKDAFKLVNELEEKNRVLEIKNRGLEYSLDRRS